MKYVILIADDEAEIRDLLRLYLENSGYDVLEAADGLEALEVLEKEHVDLACTGCDDAAHEWAACVEKDSGNE